MPGQVSSASSPPVISSVQAYVKALLHCHKYPTQAVSGFLIGKRISATSNTNASSPASNSSAAATPTTVLGANAIPNFTANAISATNADGNNVNSSGSSSDEAECIFVADAVPLFHTIIMTDPHPMMTVAYAQVSSYARTKGLVLLGYYIANERTGDTAVCSLTENVLRMLHSRKSGVHEPLLWRIVSTPSGDSVDVRGAYYNSGSSSFTDAPSLTFGRWNSDTLSCETTEPKAAAVEAFENSMDALKQFQLVDFEDHLESVQLNYLDQTVSA
ncbi:hypothetical protein, conserved [Trypanosoma brucei gambiense DAL972]|uniref:MPN domain-containing protein n=2 Tax=Trypanosoma brucei TaxID=5691 RepID=C9ZUT0_TRYB9|nr:hypothetical protein, conserved [Trypanosoma brucei gambiense DAL972]RHW70776.1 Uncharacterized protein family (UPF0172) [Trypanosoma brucei equiperdum]CBH13168.1 hypothetical protein, conserved [Trypanosoma brucei gambiense DAL972]|eukprot:XP_011775445.1 hypothetical protein, conserved [Trypanosoma brucei gambiense DAL972]